MIDIYDFVNDNEDARDALNEFAYAFVVAAEQDLIDEVSRLEKEVEALKPYKDDKDKADAELARKLQELEDEKRAVGKATLNELFERYGDFMYHADYTLEYKMEKCDKCDDDRRIEFLSPSGNRMFEPCKCAALRKRYFPEKYYSGSAEHSSRRNHHRLLVWYRKKSADVVSSIFCETIYEGGMDFKDINIDDTFFQREEDCQSYCDWLNKKEEEKANKEE
jgi:hypothetical protein